MQIRNNDPFASRVFSSRDDAELSMELVNGIDMQKFYSLLDAVDNCYGLRVTRELPHGVPSFFVYEKDCSLGPHADVYGDGQQMCVSFVIYLNDAYEGGELLIYRGDINESSLKRMSPDCPVSERPDIVAKLKPAAGSIIAFPFNVFHEVEKITFGEKIICTIILPSEV